jgi:hypothetical protein
MLAKVAAVSALAPPALVLANSAAAAVLARTLLFASVGAE